MRLGFSTNGIGDIDPLDAIPVLRELGYRSLAVTLDHQTIDPFAADRPARIARWKAALDEAGMACVIETGARHLLDLHRKHEPTLVSAAAAGRSRRTDMLLRALDVARELGAECVSLWSGVVHDAGDEETIWNRLTTALGPVMDRAADLGVVVAFEPEPGMFIDTLARLDLLVERLGRREPPRLTIDIGHMECMGERPCAALLGPRIERLANVHVDDMLACRHEHLPLGSGDVDFAPLFAALARGGYRGGLHVELPRQAHRWLETARHSAAFLAPFLPSGTADPS